MKRVMEKFGVIGLMAGVVVAVSGASVSAHVVVKPSEVVTAGYQTFSVGVPNERDVATTSVRLEIPAGLEHVAPTQKTGWDISVEKSGSGDDAKVKSITWSGSGVKPGFRDDLTFSAKVPKDAAELRWNAYQTYADGVVVAWDKETEGGHGDSENSGPFSVTKVVTETAEERALRESNQAAVEAKATATTALYVGIVAALVSLAALFFVTRKTTK